MRQAGIYSGIRFGGGSGAHSLPLARIKKIMKRSSSSGEEVKMISGDAPVVLAKACELFINELTRKSWTMTLQGKRRIVHKNDVASAVVSTDLFDFLEGLVSDCCDHCVPAGDDDHQIIINNAPVEGETVLES
ncbi:Nuclear transcription factor Y subunit C-3 [Morus notabilis]|uniref:Nuclear transcription factor Y subunit C-3 n=1 Tax=Morus notabilis TaxID=981085 RepID=W9QHF5_9ROSA|nr:nuclear transcription factor Y subunit C-3 [Morus notabilis]EXB37384.1 Nuclear transcription factor Y subunit C-3 [Morus notabilis]